MGNWLNVEGIMNKDKVAEKVNDLYIENFFDKEITEADIECVAQELKEQFEELARQILENITK